MTTGGPFGISAALASVERQTIASLQSAPHQERSCQIQFDNDEVYATAVGHTMMWLPEANSLLGVSSESVNAQIRHFLTCRKSYTSSLSDANTSSTTTDSARPYDRDTISGTGKTTQPREATPTPSSGETQNSTTPFSFLNITSVPAIDPKANKLTKRGLDAHILGYRWALASAVLSGRNKFRALIIPEGDIDTKRRNSPVLIGRSFLFMKWLSNCGYKTFVTPTPVWSLCVNLSESYCHQ